MNNNPSFTLLLVGTTAGDDNNDFCIWLSGIRAEAVKETLVSLGVPTQSILTLAGGCQDPWHIWGVGTGDGIASQNRKVVLLDAESDTAKELLQKE